MDLKTIYIIFHIFGVAIGAGGAFMSDLMYVFSTKDKKLSKTEIKFLKLGSLMTWVGLVILIISGGLLFSTNVDGYLNSSKFLIKMTVIMVLFLNGIVFHLIHMPLFEKGVEKLMHYEEDFKKGSFFVYASGAISVVSWILAIILGSLKSIPISYSQALLVYVLVLIFAIGIALVERKRFMKD